MRTPADRAHRASSRKYPSVRESLACRSCQTAYCRIATPGIPPPRVTSPHGAQAQSDSLVVADVLSMRAEMRSDVNPDHAAVVGGRARASAHQVFSFEALDQISHCRRRT